MSSIKEVVILAAARTPIGAFQGALAPLSAPKLGAAAIREALARAGVAGDAVGETYMGCVLPAGLGQAPARQASIGAGIPASVGAVTVNKVCGSGLKAVVLGANAIATGEHDVVVAGGMESMSNAPYLLPKAREGYRLGHGQVIDSMIKDGLWDAYKDVHMGDCAELCAKEKAITRADQDAFAAESYRRAQRAQAEGKFKPEIVALEIPQRKGPPMVVADDEEPGKGRRSRSRASSALPATPRRPSGSPPRPRGRSPSCSPRWGGARTTSTSGRSTRRSPSCPSPTTGCSTWIPER